MTEGAGPGARPRLTRKAKLKYDALEKRFLLLAPERGMVLSDSAAEILKRCDGTKSLAAIAGELSSATGAPVEQIERDTRAFVDEMRKRGLLEWDA